MFEDKQEEEFRERVDERVEAIMAEIADHPYQKAIPVPEKLSVGLSLVHVEELEKDDILLWKTEGVWYVSPNV